MALGRYSPCVIDKKPSLAGKIEFTGLKVIYSYYATVMVSATTSEKKQNSRRNQDVNSKNKVDHTGKMNVTGEKVLLKPVTFYDGGISQQGKSFENASL